MESNSTPYGVTRHRFYNSRKTFGYDFNYMPVADVAGLSTLAETVSSRSLGTFRPFYFCKDSAAPGEFYLVEIASLPVKHRTLGYYDTPLSMTEVLTSV